MPSKNCVCLLIMVAIGFVVPISADADPVTYIYAGIGTGSLDSVAFVNAGFTITASADTDNITVWPNAQDGPQNTHLNTTIEINGLGIHTILTASHSWMNGEGNGSGGLGGYMHGGNWITLIEPALIDYGLDTSIGPVFERSPANVNQFRNVSTSGGTLDFESSFVVSFTSVVIPEPTAALFLCGSGALIGLRRRRRV
jgi:hypothetical protein